MSKIKKHSYLLSGLYLKKSPITFVVDTKVLIRRIVFVVKHGYPLQARWDTCYWFMDTFTEIFQWYLKERCSDFICADVPVEKYSEMTDKFLQKMIYLLSRMRTEFEGPVYKENWKAEYEAFTASQNKAKNEFFELFSQFFYQLWD